MKGLGIDIVEIERIEKAMKKERFLLKLFTEKERLYIKNKGNRAETVAGLFASKEAVSKVLGSGVVYSWTDIEIDHTDKGQPIVRLHGVAKEIANEKDIVTIHVSISHSECYAVSNAIGV